MVNQDTSGAHQQPQQKDTRVTTETSKLQSVVKPRIEFKPVIETEINGMPVRTVAKVGTRDEAFTLQESKGYVSVNMVKVADMPPQPYFAAGPSHEVLKAAIVDSTPGVQQKDILGGQLALDPEALVHSMNFEASMGNSNLEVAQTIMAMVHALPPEFFTDTPLQINHFGPQLPGLPKSITYENGRLIGDYGPVGRRNMLINLQSLLS